MPRPTSPYVRKFRVQIEKLEAQAELNARIDTDLRKQFAAALDHADSAQAKLKEAISARNEFEHEYDFWHKRTIELQEANARLERVIDGLQLAAEKREAASNYGLRVHGSVTGRNYARPMVADEGHYVKCSRNYAVQAASVGEANFADVEKQLSEAVDKGLLS